MKRIAILGSTGSIGVNALDVIRRFPDRFRVVALTAHSSHKTLAKQAEEFGPKFAGLSSLAAARKTAFASGASGAKWASGPDCNSKAATRRDVDAVLNALVGMIGLEPTLKAAQSGKDILLANKETLIAGGNLVMREAKKRKVRLVPIDSEHSAIFQLLAGRRRSEIKRLILTSSGGPFLNRRGSLNNVTLREALNHPRWKMGPKITIDSATLMNKGLEIIEAKWLFGLDASKIDVVIHPQSLIHSMVELTDGSVLAQVAVTDMRIPIQYALSYPERLPSGGEFFLDFSRIESFSFKKPDKKRFPCLELGFECCARGGTAPVVLNGANEAANSAFQKERIHFLDIPRLIEMALDAHEKDFKTDPELEDILEADRWARRRVANDCRRLRKFL